LLLASLALAAALSAGCTGRLITEGKESVLGAKGIVAGESGMTPPAEFMLAQYRHFELAGFTDDMNGHVPPELFSHLSSEFSKQLADKGIPNSSGKTLLIRGRVLYYEDASTLGTVLGPFEEAVARVEFVDKDSGRTLTDCYCVGRTESLRQKGARGKAEGLAKAITTWIAKRYPKAQKVK
jgi:hypothetical protein